MMTKFIKERKSESDAAIFSELGGTQRWMTALRRSGG